MKQILIAFSMFLCLESFAQDSLSEYKHIDSVSSSKAELYTKAKIWISNRFKSAKDVIQMDDKEAGRIMAKGLFELPVKGFLTTFYDYIRFTIAIDVKEKKYRIIVNNLKHEGGSYRNSVDGGSFENEKPACGTFFMTKGKWRTIKEESGVHISELIQDFNLAMKKPMPTSDF